MSHIEIITGFDGSCPKEEAMVEKTGPADFVIYPCYRQMRGITKDCGSRMSVRLRNNGQEPAEALLTADWRPYKDKMPDRDYGFIRHEGGEWTMVPGDRVVVEGEYTRTQYRLKLAPGLTWLGWFPEYNYAEDLAVLIDRLREVGVPVESIGQSREGRDLWLARFDSTSPRARDFFIQARDHASETAGSFCVEGIIDFLLSDEPLAAYLRSKFNFHIVPMTNVDGVANGMSRITWEEGIDMNRLEVAFDAAHQSLKGAVDRVRPFVHMNLHCWENKFRDGMFVDDQALLERLLLYMPDDIIHFKKWRLENTLLGWGAYCRQEFGAAAGVTFEFPWFGLDSAAMKAKGVRALQSLALSVVGEQGL